MKSFSNLSRMAFVCLCAALVACVSATDVSAITNYSQDFEGLDPNDFSVGPLGGDGWLVGANVFDPNGAFLYNYFAFPAPNGSGGFSNLSTAGTGAPVGNVGLVVFSDYNNGDHGVGNLIEANVFQEQTIVPSDVGKTADFSFIAAPGDLGGATTALAFIKTIDPNNGNLTNFVTQDTTSLPAGNSSFTLSLPIDGSLVGQLFQFGFLNVATNFDPSGVNYDNVNLAIPEPGTICLAGLALTAFVGMRRRQ